MELEPGFIVREEMPLGPRVAVEGRFESLAEPLVDALGGSDGALFSLQTTIAGNVADGLDARFTETIGAAEDVADSHRGAGDDQTADALVDTGAGAEAYRQSVLRHLPQPDAPIDSGFRDLPGLGSGHPGAGGVEGDPGEAERI